MKKLTLVFADQYRKSPSEKQRTAGLPGTIVYVYKVSGDQKHIDAYIESKKKDPKCNMASIKKENGDVMFYSIRALKNPDGSIPNLIETSKGEWIGDTSKAEMLANLTAQYGFEIASKMVQEPAAQ